MFINENYMNLLIINTLPIPSGQASVNRLLSLAKGLVLEKVTVTILSTAKGSDSEFHSISGVKYCNLQYHNNKIIALCFSLCSLIKYIYKKREEIDVIWLVSNSLLIIYPLWLICKLCKIPYIQEKSEFPFVLMKKGLFARLWAYFYVHTTYKLFDGMIIMTQPLMNYFSSLVKKKCKLIKVPMTVDMERFENGRGNNQFGEYAAYCGYMGGNKDGVENLLEAFTYVEKEYPYFNLVLVGNASSTLEFDSLKEKATEYGLKNVIFTGKVDREVIPSILCNAKILCLARPSSLQSLGGFPTKLGEYLSTANPVIVTAVGEIPNYLDLTNSYLVEPDNNKLFGETIIKVLDEYTLAKQVALKGKLVAKQNFDCKLQARRLVNYFNSIIN